MSMGSSLWVRALRSAWSTGVLSGSGRASLASSSQGPSSEEGLMR